MKNNRSEKKNAGFSKSLLSFLLEMLYINFALCYIGTRDL